MVFSKRSISALVVCGLCASSAQAQQITVREVTVTRGDPSAPFGEITDAVEVSDGSILVADAVADVVWRWLPETGDVDRIFRHGEGPGEVLSPLRLATRPDGGVAVYDVGQSAVNLFDRSLEFEERVRLPGIVSWPKGMLVLPDGSFVLAGGQLSHSNDLHRFDRTGRAVQRWGSPHPDALDPSTRIQTAGGALTPWSDSSFVFSKASPIRIVEFPHGGWDDLDTLVTDDLLEAPTDDNFLIPRDDRITALRWGFPRSTFVHRLDGESILNVVTRAESDDSIWTIYDGDGRPRSRTRVDHAYEVRQWLDDGRLLASRKDPLTDEGVLVVLEVTGW